MRAGLVVMYLTAIVVANLIVARFGAPALAVTAWVLIPFDMCSKDTLQIVWSAKHGTSGMWSRVGLLVAAGGLLTVACSTGAAAVAVASVSAFTAAALTDTAVFAVTSRTLTRLQRVNVSNLAAFAVDSVLFQAIAFGAVDWRVSTSQALAKTVGGFLWSIVLARTVWQTRWFSGQTEGA